MDEEEFPTAKRHRSRASTYSVARNILVNHEWITSVYAADVLPLTPCPTTHGGMRRCRRWSTSNEQWYFRRRIDRLRAQILRYNMGEQKDSRKLWTSLILILRLDAHAPFIMLSYEWGTGKSCTTSEKTRHTSPLTGLFLWMLTRRTTTRGVVEIATCMVFYADAERSMRRTSGTSRVPEAGVDAYPVRAHPYPTPTIWLQPFQTPLWDMYIVRDADNGQLRR